MGKKKYTFERGEYIGDSVIRYISEAGYSKDGKHRLILGVCDFCNTIQPFRLESIIRGKTKSCGCRHRELVERGKLASYYVKARKNNNKTYIKSGGWRERGLVLFLPTQYKESLGELKIKDILRNIEELENKQKARHSFICYDCSREWISDTTDDTKCSMCGSENIDYLGDKK